MNIIYVMRIYHITSCIWYYIYIIFCRSNKRKVNILTWIALQMNLNVLLKVLFHIIMLYTCFKLNGPFKIWLGQPFFLVFIVNTVSIVVWFFSIPGFKSMNVLLKLIVRENLWPQQMFFYVFTRVYSLSVCVCEREREKECVCTFAYMHLHSCIHTSTYIYFQGCCFSFISLPPRVECKIVSLCECMR